MEIDYQALASKPPDTPEAIEHWRLRKPQTYLAGWQNWPPVQGPLGQLIIFRPKRPRIGWRPYSPPGGSPHAA